MANVRVSTAAQNAMCNALVDLIDAGAASPSAGKIQIYDGSQPANANTAVSGQNLLAELAFSTTAFGSAANGVATANTIADDTAADATGTASWARILDSDDTVIFDCDVGTSGATINLNTVSLVQNGAVEITSFTITHPSGA
jgi:hypothetical protein